MTKRDATIADITKAIIESYNKTQNPPPLQEDLFKKYKIVHSPQGYSLYEGTSVYITYREIDEFIIQLFEKVGGHVIEIKDIEENKSVIRALKELLDYDDITLYIKTNPPYHGVQAPCIWTRTKSVMEEEVLKNKEFTYLGDELWAITL